jgi:D-threo-aldose 1-dehydrogenase
MQQVELQGPKLSVSAVGFGCGGFMRSPSRNERMAVLGSATSSGGAANTIAGRAR